ncbi:MAG: ParB family transcriptional regulator, chromosome partitioning protein [Solirubrobacterales bacterium]|nr:ParB family transcriptional regulator, chromosome partitioning protein [Solirubrobacterales bacterium]
MAATKRGMGKGLAAILPEAASGGPELLDLAVGKIEPNPDQPRSEFEAGPLQALADSISSTGLLQPLIVRPLDAGGERYELIAGERRWRAARQAGLKTVPAVVRVSPDDDRLQAALIENMVREDLNPVDEARACASLVDDLGISKEELGRRVGRSRAAISNLIRILDLPDEALALLSGGDLSEGHGRALLLVRDQGERRKLARRAAKDGWSVRETERRAKAAGEPARPKAKSVSADEKAAMTEAEDSLGEALGADVRVRAAGKEIKAELRFSDMDELKALAKRISRS